MKVVDVAMDKSKDCVAMSVSKQKKLKQARLPFQMLSSPLSPNTAPKKRKMSASSPTSCKGPKVLKVEKKENSMKPSDIVEVDMTSDKEDSSEEGSEIAESSNAVSHTKEKKQEPKSSMKPGALTRFLQKVTATPPRPPPPRKDLPVMKSVPVVVLKRCDERKAPSPSESGNESSEEILALDLAISDDDDEAESKKEKKTTDDNLDDSDSDCETSSSEDEKNSNEEGEDVAKPSLDNNILRTPSKNIMAEQVVLKKKRLTPKQLEKKLENAKKREEREKIRAKQQMQRNQEKMKRRKEREEQKKKDKEQRELKKQMEIEQRHKEKERKEEERKKREEAKEEEKRKKEEEKLGAERKKQKEASTFVSFFVAKKQENKTSEEKKIDKTSNFMPFQVKADMKVAPLCRRSLTDEEKVIIDDCLRECKKHHQLYLGEIKENGWKIRKSGKTYPTEVKEEDVAIIDEDEDDEDSSNVVNEPVATSEKYRAKLLLFTENRRPPYWGTWRKKSSSIKPRRPFAKDSKLFDYDVDSDEEWEEEEPGESLRGSDDEKDEENPDDNEYDVDNEFMVPHGYLSDEEAQADEEDEEVPAELQKDKLKILEEEFEAEMKTKTAKIKPKVIGCIWQGFFNVYPENTPKHIINFLKERQAWLGETPIALNPPVELERESIVESTSNKKPFPEEAVPHLIRLIHGNLLGRPFLVKEFLTYWHKNYPGDESSFTKIGVTRKIKEISKRIACPEEGSMHLKNCLYVPEEYRKKYSVEDITLPNQWNYFLTPKRKTLAEPPEVIDKPDKEGKEKMKDGEKELKKAAPLITMFTKKMTPDEMKKQLKGKPSFKKKVSTSINRPPKRVALISIPRGQEISKASIKSTLSKVSNTKKYQQAAGSADEPITISDDDNKNPVKKSPTKESTSAEDKRSGTNNNKKKG